MPPLRDVQHAMRRSMIGRDDADASIYIVADGISAQDRLSVYRNTFVQTLIRALRLSYPAIDRLVGAEFFDAAALDFITAQPPRSAYLDEYGGDFPAFLEWFAPAASVPYLADVALLEWAVSRALHAPDAPALAIALLGAVDAADYAEIRFEPHPSVGLVHTEFPADTIWRAVLDDDAAALAVLDLSNGPAWLIVQRSESGVEVDRVDEAAWLFVHALCARQPLGLALENHRGIDAQTVLADLLAHGRFTGFNLTPQPSRRNR